MTRRLGLVLAGVLGCGSTLPSEESVLLSVAPARVLPGAEVRAVLVNASSERLEGALSCWLRIIDQVTQQPIAPQEECDAPAMFFEPDVTYRFTFTAPVVPGDYRLEVPISASDPESESDLFSVRSQPFLVSTRAVTD